MVLTDDEIAKLGCDHGKATECEGYKHNTLWFDGDCTDFARAIELAVIEKIKAQGAECWQIKLKHSGNADFLSVHYHGTNAIADYRTVDPDATVTALYAIPEDTCTTS